MARAGLGGSELAPDCGILFVADTSAQMERAVKLLTQVRAGEVGSGCFGLIIDEADSFQRTEDDTLKLEQRLNDLKGIGLGWKNDKYYDTLNYDYYGGSSFQGANVIVSISATLLPVLLKMFKVQQENKARSRSSRRLSDVSSSTSSSSGGAGAGESVPVHCVSSTMRSQSKRAYTQHTHTTCRRRVLSFLFRFIWV